MVSSMWEALSVALRICSVDLSSVPEFHVGLEDYEESGGCVFHATNVREEEGVKLNTEKKPMYQEITTSQRLTTSTSLRTGILGGEVNMSISL